MTTLRHLVLITLAALAIGACSSAAAPSAPASTAPGATPPPSTSAPSDGADTSPGDPGASDPNAPVAPDAPVDSGDGPILDPSGGRIVVPKPGQLDVHPVAAQTLTADVEGRRVLVSVAYTSGVEPCYVLDSIVVRTGPSSFEITLREGHGPEDVACIEIAESKRAIVDLGELQPGTYQITDGAGGAAPISVMIA